MPDSDKRRPIVVCDASPLIFLAKVNRLELIESVTPRKPVVLRGVMEEVLSDRAEWLLADERLLRRFARERGIQVIGFCGLLLQAVRMDQMTSQQALSAIDTAIREHGFRISIKLYQKIMQRLSDETVL